MADTTLSEVIKSSTVVVHAGRYAYLKLPAGQEIQLGKNFLIAKDADEITVVTEEKNIHALSYEKDVKWFTLMEIKVSLPFLATGFIAAISKSIADRRLNILVVSTFSKDYLLVR